MNIIYLYTVSTMYNIIWVGIQRFHFDIEGIDLLIPFLEFYNLVSETEINMQWIYCLHYMKLVNSIRNLTKYICH